MANPKHADQAENSGDMLDQASAPAPKAVAAPLAVKKPVVALNQTRLSEASFRRTEWCVTAPQGTIFEDILVTDYWRNVGQMLKPCDMIDVVTEDGAWYARLIVISSDRLWAKVTTILHVDLTAAKRDMPSTDFDNHDIIWKGPMSKFAVIRKKDSAALKDGFTSKLDAMQWLDGHLKSLAA